MEGSHASSGIIGGSAQSYDAIRSLHPTARQFVCKTVGRHFSGLENWPISVPALIWWPDNQELHGLPTLQDAYAGLVKICQRIPWSREVLSNA